MLLRILGTWLLASLLLVGLRAFFRYRRKTRPGRELRRLQMDLEEMIAEREDARRKVIQLHLAARKPQARA